jgi:hypothetical protein
MVKSAGFELDEVAFTADINPTDLPTPVQDLLVGIRGQTTAAASITGTTLLNTISLLRVFVGGTLQTEISGEELLAYNVLALNNIPRKVNSGASATNPAILQGLKLPVQIPAAKKAQIQVVYAAQTNVGSGVIAVHLQKLEKLLGPLQGLLRKPFTPTLTAAFARAMDISLPGAKIAGLLLFSTTIPVSTAVTTSLHRLRLIVAGNVHSEYSWMNMGAGNLLTGGDSDIDGAIDNYRWIPMDEPIPADDVKVDIYADDTNPVRIIPLYQYA